MKNISYWLDSEYTPRPELAADIQAEVVVIGGGITGVSAAYHCAKQGLNTVLIEKNAIASGPAGKNGGMVVEGLAIDYIEAQERWGETKAKEAWQGTQKARECIASLVGENDLDCDFFRSGSLYLAKTPEQQANLREENRARAEAGFACKLLEEGVRGPNGFPAALYVAEDCVIHPAKFVRGLAAAAEKSGLRIYENTYASGYTASTVTTPHGVITAEKVVVAVESNTTITPEQGTIIGGLAVMTEPFTESDWANFEWQKGGIFWTSESAYITMSKVGHRLCASQDLPVTPTPQELEEGTGQMIAIFREYFPSVANRIAISHRWYGSMLYPRRHLPYITQREGIYHIYGQGGQGLTNGTMTGKMLAESFAGKEIPSLYREGNG